MKTINSKPFNLIILGDVGAGKATQSTYFAKKYNMQDFDMGRELTLLRQKDQKVDATQKRTADKGVLTPTAIVRGLLERTIKSTSPKKGILFDGHPKMIGEAKIVRNLLEKTKRVDPLVIYIKIPKTETIKRIASRKGYSNTLFKKRSDDTISGLKNRANYYRTQISKVIKYFNQHYQFVSINGVGTKAEVRKRIQRAIDNYLSNYAEVHKKT